MLLQYRYTAKLRCDKHFLKNKKLSSPTWSPSIHFIFKNFFFFCSIDLMCVHVSCVPVTCLTQEVTSHSACWPQSQTRGQAIVTSTTLLPCRRWYMPPRSGYTSVDNTTPEQLEWTMDTDTMPSMRSPSVAGEELHIFIQRCTISSDSSVVCGVWVAREK